MSEYTLRGSTPPEFDGSALRIGRGWKVNAILATRGNQTFLGCVILAVIGQVSENPVRIISAAEIFKDGLVYANVQLRGMGPGQSGLTPLCTAEELRDDFRRLSDFLKLTDEQREDMNRELRAWIKLDHRQTVELGLNPNLKEV